VTVRAGTENVGSGEFSGEIVYYMSEDQNVSTGDVRLGDDTETLDPGASDSEEIQFTPSNFSELSPGEYYVGVIIPSENEVWTRNDPVELTSSGADLVARDISWSPDPAQLSEEVTVEVVIGNDGNASAADRTVNYYLSGDADLNTEGDNVKVGDDVFSIGTEDVTESATFVPENYGGLGPGEWHVIAQFPSESEFWRFQDKTLTLDSGGDPDIRVSTSSLSFTLPSGESGTKSFTIENTGDADLDWSINLGGSSAEGAGKVTGERRGPTTEWAELRAAARKEGKIPVIVHLNVQTQPEGALSQSAAQAQRAAIGQAQENVVNALKQAGAAAESVRRYDTVPYIALRTDETGIKTLEPSPNVERVERDEPVPPNLGESISIVGADDAWSSGYSGQGQVVGILDTGVDADHPALSGKVEEEACYSNGGGEGETVCPSGSREETGSGAGQPCDTNGCDHGTHVSGIAAGSGSLPGVAKDADVIAVQLFTKFTGSACDGTGSDPCVLAYRRDQIAALEFIYQNRSSYDIASANMSLGGGRFEEPCSADPRADIVNNLRSTGIATIASSGNGDFTEAMGAPACIPSVVSVGSTEDGSRGTTKDAVSRFSNSADFLDLLAPGETIRSSVPGGDYEGKNGTSMAAPHVAGAWAVYKSKNPGASVAQVLSALAGSGVQVTDSRNGITKPRLRIDRALQTEAWISFEPSSGVLSPSDSRDVQVTSDAGDLSSGTYTETLEITSNDPDEDPIEVAVNLTVESDAAPPTASDDSAQTTEGQSVTTSVLANDSDPDGSLDASSVQVESGPSDGTASANSDGTITYEPNAGFTGTDSYTYTVADSEGARSEEATVTIEVNAPENQAPEVVTPIPNDTLLIPGPGTQITGLQNVFDDSDGDPLTFSANSSNPGVVEVVTVTPQVLVLQPGDVGEASLSLTASDPSNATATDSFSVVVEERPEGKQPPSSRSSAVVSLGDSSAVGFGQTGVGALFRGVQTSGTVEVSYFADTTSESSDASPTFVPADSFDNVSRYRWNIDNQGVTFDSADVAFALANSGVVGIGEPDTVSIIKGTEGTDDFEVVPTVYDDGGTPDDPSDDTLVGQGVTSFSTFKFASNDDDNPLPVELATFTAKQNDGAALLRWRTASETNNAGFEVQHKGPDAPDFSEVGYVASKSEGGTSRKPTSYQFEVADLSPGTHQFRLRQVDTDGGEHLSRTTSLTLQMEEALRLTSPAPNPVRTRTQLRFGVRDAGKATVSLYNVLGQRVARLYDGSLTPGEMQTVKLGGRRLSGLPSGVYFVRLEAHGEVRTRRLVVVN